MRMPEASSTLNYIRARYVMKRCVTWQSVTLQNVMIRSDELFSGINRPELLVKANKC